MIAMGSIQSTHNKIESTSNRIDDTVLSMLKNSNKCIKQVINTVVFGIKDRLDIARNSDNPLAFKKFESEVYESLGELHELALKTKKVCGVITIENNVTKKNDYIYEYTALCDIIKIIGSIIIEQKVFITNESDLVESMKCLHNFDYDTYLTQAWNKSVASMLEKLNLDIKREKFEKYRDAREAERQAQEEAERQAQAQEEAEKQARKAERQAQEKAERQKQKAERQAQAAAEIAKRIEEQKEQRQYQIVAAEKVYKKAKERYKYTKGSIVVNTDSLVYNSDESIRANFMHAGHMVYVEPTCTAYELNLEEKKKLSDTLRKKAIVQGLARVCNIHNPVEIVAFNKKISLKLLNSLTRYEDRPLYKVHERFEGIYNKLDENSKHLLNTFQITPYGVINRVACFDEDGLEIMAIILKETLMEHISNNDEFGIIQNNLDISRDFSKSNIFSEFNSEVALAEKWVNTEPSKIDKREIIEKAIKALYTAICTYDIYRTRMYILMTKLYTYKNMKFALDTNIYYINKFKNTFFIKEREIKQAIMYKGTIQKMIDNLNFVMAQSLVILAQLQNYADNYLHIKGSEFILYADLIDIRIREEIVNMKLDPGVEGFNLSNIEDFLKLMTNLRMQNNNAYYIRNVVLDTFGVSLSKEREWHKLLVECRKYRYSNISERLVNEEYSREVGFPRVKQIPQKYLDLKKKNDKKLKNNGANNDKNGVDTNDNTTKPSEIIVNNTTKGTEQVYSEDELQMYKEYVSEYIRMYEDITGIKCDIPKDKLKNPSEDGMMAVKTGRLTDNVLCHDLGLKKTIDVIREKVGYTGIELRISSYDSLRCLFGENLNQLIQNVSIQVLLDLVDSLCIIKEYYKNESNVFLCAVNLLATAYKTQSGIKSAKDNIRNIAKRALEMDNDMEYYLSDLISIGEYRSKMDSMTDPFTGMTYTEEIRELLKLDEYKEKPSASLVLKVALHKYVKPNVSMNLRSMMANGIIDNPAKCLLIDPSKARQITIWLNNSACITKKPDDLSTFTLNLNSKIIESK